MSQAQTVRVQLHVARWVHPLLIAATLACRAKLIGPGAIHRVCKLITDHGLRASTR